MQRASYVPAKPEPNQQATEGGYVVYEAAGKEQQKFGADFPEWRKQMKTRPLARTRRHLAQASAF